MSKLWLKDHKLLVKDNRLLLADECCCESPFPCSFSKSVTAQVSTAMADTIGDIYDTCAYWWTDPETGETYCEWYDYTRSNLPGYARWCDRSEPGWPYNQMMGFHSPPYGGTAKTGRITCQIGGEVYPINYNAPPYQGTYVFRLHMKCDTRVLSPVYPGENTWGVLGSLALSVPAIPEAQPGLWNETYFNPQPCGDDHGVVWINGELRGAAWHGWFVPECWQGDTCYGMCMEALADLDKTSEPVAEEVLLGLFGGFHLATGAWDGACCGYCTGGGISLELYRGISEETARQTCRAWTRANAINIGITDG